jgi:hypothetical protein
MNVIRSSVLFLAALFSAPVDAQVAAYHEATSAQHLA